MGLIKNSTNVEIDNVFDNGKKWEANVRGQYKTMTSNEGFSKKQLEQIAQVVVATIQPMLQPIKEDVGELKQDMKEEVKSRLDGVEKDIKDIKSCPTIQREIIAE